MSRFQFLHRTRKRSHFRRSRHFVSTRGSVVEWLKWSSKTIVILVGIQQYGKMHEQMTKSQRWDLAARAGKKALYFFGWGLRPVSRKKNDPEDHFFFRCSLFIPWKVIDKYCSIKMARYSPRSFLRVNWPRGSRGTQKKITWPISCHLVLTLCKHVNNLYFLRIFYIKLSRIISETSLL